MTRFKAVVRGCSTTAFALVMSGPVPAHASQDLEHAISKAITVAAYPDGTLEILGPHGGLVRTNNPPVPSEDVSVNVCWDRKWDGRDPNRITYPPVPVAADGAVGHVQYVFGLFRLENARKLAGGEWQRQYEVCSRGLGQSDAEHWSMQTAGAAQADTRQGDVTRIGWEFKTGPTPPTYSLTYGFAMGSALCAGTPSVKACSDGSVSGKLEQVKSGELRGGFKAPMGQLQQYWQNTVAGWWDGTAVGGAKAFQSQGSIVHALWEYPMLDPAGAQPILSYEVYARFTCTRFFGLGCNVEPPTS